MADCTKWSVTDIPIEMRNLWSKIYEEVKFLKVQFKYWCLDISEEVVFRKQVSIQKLHSQGRCPELRYSYDPDNCRRSMDCNNILKRRNAKHVIGARLNRPWYFNLRPTFNDGQPGHIQTATNPWFDTSVIFAEKDPKHPNQRNAYLWDFLNKFQEQRLACQRIITVGLKGRCDFSKYLPKVEASPLGGALGNDYREMKDELDIISQDVMSFDSSQGFDTSDMVTAT